MVQEIELSPHKDNIIGFQRFIHIHKVLSILEGIIHEDQFPELLVVKDQNGDYRLVNSYLNVYPETGDKHIGGHHRVYTYYIAQQSRLFYLIEPKDLKELGVDISDVTVFRWRPTALKDIILRFDNTLLQYFQIYTSDIWRKIPAQYLSLLPDNRYSRDLSNKEQSEYLIQALQSHPAYHHHPGQNPEQCKRILYHHPHY